MRTQIPGHLEFNEGKLTNIILPQDGILMPGFQYDEDRYVGTDITTLEPYLVEVHQKITGTFSKFVDGKYVGECYVLNIRDGELMIQDYEIDFI